MDAESQIHPNYRGMVKQGAQATSLSNLSSTRAELNDMGAAGDAHAALNRRYGVGDADSSQRNMGDEGDMEELGHN